MEKAELAAVLQEYKTKSSRNTALALRIGPQFSLPGDVVSLRWDFASGGLPGMVSFCKRLIKCNKNDRDLAGQL